MAEQEIAEIRALKATLDVRPAGCYSLYYVLELVDDTAAKEISRPANDDDNENTRYDQRKRLWHRKPAHERLRAQPHQHGDNNRAECHQYNAEEIPDQNGNERNRDDNERPL